MSFLQLISNQSPHRQVSNPAFLQLDNRKVLPRWNSFKSEPKERRPTSPVLHPNLVHAPIPHQKTSCDGTEERIITDAFGRKLFARGKKHSCSSDRQESKSNSPFSVSTPTDRNSQPKPNHQQYHHSFSNYISRKVSGRGGRNQGKLMYLDLTEIVNKIVSPMKLEHKLEEGDLTPPPRLEKQGSFAQYEHFLKEVNCERIRYQHFDEEVKTSRTFERVCRRPNTLWLRKPLGRKRQGVQITPWTQTQEQNSPILSRTQQFSAFPSPIIDNLQDLL